MKKLKMLTGAIMVMASMVFSLSCERHCVDCPNEPEPPPAGNYRLYVWDDYAGLLMSIDIPADTLVDSVHTDFSGYDLFVTPGGDRLLLTHYEYPSGDKMMEIYRASDLTHIGTISQYGDYFFDGHDNYGIWSSLEKLYFINPVTLAPLDSLPLGIREGYLDTVANIFFGSKLAADSNGYSIEWNVIYEIDCISRTLIDTFILRADDDQIDIWPYQMAYNWKTGDYYFHGTASAGVSYFYQYNLKAIIL